ncbi:MAG TPA: D-alanyl-D-alanine carboxypeptidase family protein [Blastocatellia bacterium]|nr:D-alanyl-D-alanine carboxypeptidase family protein [Blastocatellia bacterium]
MLFSKQTRYIGILLIAATLIGFGLLANADGQANRKGSVRVPKYEESSISSVSSAAKASRMKPAFDHAASMNEVLKSELTWSFGGKSQRGWYLYSPLISSMIGAEDQPASPRFALKLSSWQGTNGLQQSGVLDEKTWSQMVTALQASRLRDLTAPADDRLVTAPISDFYDPTRAEELRRVERRTYEAYRRMIKAAAADQSLMLAPGEKYLKIISAFRSQEYQDQLRRQSPTAGRAGLAINSHHLTGRALDLYVGGEPVSTKDQNRAIQIKTPAYRWLVKNAPRFGFQPYFYEPWHWEYVSN